ncbi:MAG: outer membrane beta-barrel protein [Thermodesulfobacteriota bacterium]
MRKRLAVVMAVIAVAGLSASAFAAEYDRYERDYRPPAQYRQEPPPPAYRAEAPRPPRHAQHGEPYFFAHFGIFDPNNDFNGLRGYDTGGAFDIGIGSRVSPVFAVEGTFGGFGAELGASEVTVVPITIGGRLIVPNPFVEPYFGAGVGLYMVSLQDAFFGIDDDSAEFGGYVSIGADFWLNPRIALNFEGKYHWVDATFDSFNTATGVFSERNIEVGGWTANFGVRVSF